MTRRILVPAIMILSFSLVTFTFYNWGILYFNVQNDARDLVIFREDPKSIISKEWFEKFLMHHTINVEEEKDYRFMLIVCSLQFLLLIIHFYDPFKPPF